MNIIKQDNFNEDEEEYLKEKELIQKLIYKLNQALIFISLSGLIVINSLQIKVNYNNIKKAKLELELDDIKDIKLEDIKRRIYNSNNLTDEEKKYLYNEEFLSDILDLVNQSNYAKYCYGEKFSDINIITYDDDEFANYKISGYYQEDNPNIVNVKSYDNLNENTMDIVAHEFVHLCQVDYEYNALTEAGAEIISNEYFDNNQINAYHYVVKEVKKLMEIIGSEPVFYYNFTGDFKMIESKVKPFLSDYEYQEFLRCLSIDFFNIDDYSEKIVTLNNIISVLYQKVYHKDIKDDLIIKLIDENNVNLHRYYFNSRLINEENSYYTDKSFYEIQRYTLKEAILGGLIKVKYVNNIRVSYDIAQELKDDGEIIMTHLLDDGTIEYFLYQEKELSYNDYINYSDNSEVELEYLYSSSDYFEGETFIHFEPVKKYLPTILERERKNKILSKIHTN